MTSIIRQKITYMGFLALGLGLAANCAHACSSTTTGCATWTFSGSSTDGVLGGTMNSDTQIGITATASAWDSINPTVSTPAPAIQTAYLGFYSGNGLGVNEGSGTTTPPQHAVDNSQYTESVMFTFNKTVNLSSFDAGYVSGDSDYTVLAYTGLGTPTLAGHSYSYLVSHGWTLIGNYNGTAATGAHDFSTLQNLAVNGTNGTNAISSSYWLIGAYNTMVGGAANGATAGDDFFKILTLTGCDCSTAPAGTPGCGGTVTKGVPEPGTLLLMSAGFIGLARINRRPPKLRS
jgi:PEP-CTERM motif-containing protein